MMSMSGPSAARAALTRAAETCGGPSMAPTRIFTRLEAALGDVGFELVADLVGAFPAARGIGRHRLQPCGRRAGARPARRPTLPKMSHSAMSTALIAATDMPRRAICGMAWPAAAAVVGARAVVQHVPDRADVARIAADQLRPDLVVQHVDQRAVGCRRCRRRSCLRPSRRCRHRSRCAGSQHRTSAPDRSRCGAGAPFRWVCGPTRL